MADTCRHEFDAMPDLANEALSDSGLERLVLSGAREPHGLRRVEIRPVLVRGQRLLQVVRYDDKRSVTANVPSPDDPQVQRHLSAFRNLMAQTTRTRTEARLTKRGRTLVSVVTEGRAPDLRHDRRKHRILAEDAPFLDLLGLSADGRIKPSQQAKWRQINEYLRLLTSLPPFPRLVKAPRLRIADMGSGNAYLTFATYHYLTQVLGVACDMVGVDRDADAVARAAERARVLGWSGLTFVHGNIADVELAWRPHLVISLHACDTGSDDAAMRALTAQADAILLAPCCHHHLQTQLERVHHDHRELTPALLRAPVLRERLGDVLTDALRGSLLASYGYRTDVVEFVSPEHTAKNLMIRGWRDDSVDRSARRDEYEQLRDTWHVRPYLEQLLSR